MKKQLSLLISLCLIIFSCPSNNNENPNDKNGIDTPADKPIPPFEMELPPGFDLLKQASGDLNKDGLDENVVVLNTGEMGEFGEKRVLMIFKAVNGEWKLWERATGAILPSEQGGMFGDPFKNISIEKGAIVIKHFGGSNSSWEYIHRFRYQNDAWELIGATSSNEYRTELETFDYNLSSGNVIYKKQEIDYDNQGNRKIIKTKSKANFVSKKKTLPRMDGFIPGEIYAINPKTKKCYPPNNCPDSEPRDLEIPETYTIIKETSGDINKNGIAEKVFVFDISEVDAFSVMRELQIYELSDSKWVLWYASSRPVLGSEYTESSDDPLKSIEVENGTIVIKHSGTWENKPWNYTHRWRDQNGWIELIGATYVTEDKCKSRSTFDYNLTSGNVIIKNENLMCKNGKNPKVKSRLRDKNFVYKMDALPNMENFYPKQVYAVDLKENKCFPVENCGLYYKSKNKHLEKYGESLQSFVDLTGVYALGGHYESWVLNLELLNSLTFNSPTKLQATFHTIDGMLPEDLYFLDGGDVHMKEFEINFKDLSFNSDLGRGEIRVDGDGDYIITFLDIESHIDDKLVLTKVDDD